MQRIKLMRFLFGSATVLLTFLIGNTDQAQGRCPPGYYPIGGGSAGWEGCAPIPGAPEPNYSPNSRPNPPNQPYRPPQSDPVQSILNLAFDMIKLVESSAKRVDQLTNDPKFHRYHNGGWDFFQSQNNATPGEYCTAFFWKKDGFVRLSGPGGDYKGAFLTFWGKDIPRPEKLEKIKATLSQSDGMPQTVQAFNHFLPGEVYGAISFAVPTIEMALATMKDVESFDIAVEGKSVAKVEWHSGLMARDKLRECVNARTKK
jgi:hypothetical protein